MKRKLRRGIFYYPMEVDHTSNKRIRLLYNDYGSDGYWIWSNIICQAYQKHGYYFETDDESVELLAADCRKSPELCNDVIACCVKRGLFVKHIFDNLHVLTNDRMQSNYLKATYEIRRKGTVVYLSQKLFSITEKDLIFFTAKSLMNIVFQESGENIFGNPQKIGVSKEEFDSSEEKTIKIPGMNPIFLGNKENIPVYNDNDNDNDNDNENITPEIGVASEFINKHDDGSDQAKKIGGKGMRRAPKKAPEPYQKMFVDIFEKNWIELRGTEYEWQPKEFAAIRKISIVLRKRNSSQWTIDVATQAVEMFIKKAKLDSLVSKNNFDNFYYSFFIGRINTILSIKVNENGQGTYKQSSATKPSRASKNAGGEILADKLRDEISVNLGGEKSS